MQPSGFLSGLGNGHPCFSSKGICERRFRNASQVKYRYHHFWVAAFKRVCIPKKGASSCRGQCPRLAPDKSWSLCLEVTSPPSWALLPLEQTLWEDSLLEVPQSNIHGSQIKKEKWRESVFIPESRGYWPSLAQWGASSSPEENWDLPFACLEQFRQVQEGGKQWEKGWE